MSDFKEKEELKGKYIHAESLMKWLEEKEEFGILGYGGSAAFIQVEEALLLMPAAEVQVVGKSGKFEPEELNEILQENDAEYEEYVSKINVKLPEEKRKNLFLYLFFICAGFSLTIFSIACEDLNCLRQLKNILLLGGFVLSTIAFGMLSYKNYKKEKARREKIKEELDKEDN